tara:strand:+ start:30 stop:209 length:180 start_codon:yes stop_codon:yes gene_type:complete
MKYLCAIRDLLISLVASTIIIYAINIIAGFGGAEYSFTNGEAFIVWILMAILINNCLKK